MSARADRKPVYHVYPVNDLDEHAVDNCFDECRCHPRVQEESNGYVIVHNSFDGRERMERYFAP